MLRACSAIFLLIPLVAAGCGGAEPSDSAPDETTADLSSSNGRTAFNYFVGKGLTETEAAAIVGNLQQESSINPASVQPDGPGRGIAQWSVGERWNGSGSDSLRVFAEDRGLSTSSLSTQLEFIWYELENYPMYGLAKLRAAKSLTSATLVFQTDFEVCGACAQGQRLAYAESALKNYGH